MADQRELILSRLVAVCGAVPGVANVVRNRLDVSQLDRPAIIVLDGSEHLLDAPPSGASQFPQIQRMEVLPALSIHVRGNAAVDGGGLLSLYRSRVLGAVLSDATLLGYCWQGRIRFGGAAVAVPGAEAQEHRIDLSLVFTYTWRLEDILAEAPLLVPVRVDHPSSGDAIVLLAGEYALYVATGPLDSLTVRLPPSAPVGTTVEISFAAPVSDLVVQDAAGAAVIDAPTQGYGPGAALQMRYVDLTLGWVYWK